MLKGRETLTCDDFVAIYKGVIEGSLACASLAEVLEDFDALGVALPD